MLPFVVVVSYVIFVLYLYGNPIVVDCLYKIVLHRMLQYVLHLYRNQNFQDIWIDSYVIQCTKTVLHMNRMSILITRIHFNHTEIVLSCTTQSRN